MASFSALKDSIYTRDYREKHKRGYTWVTVSILVSVMPHMNTWREVGDNNRWLDNISFCPFILICLLIFPLSFLSFHFSLFASLFIFFIIITTKSIWVWIILVSDLPQPPQSHSSSTTAFLFRHQMGRVWSIERCPHYHAHTWVCRQVYCVALNAESVIPWIKYKEWWASIS